MHGQGRAPWQPAPYVRRLRRPRARRPSRRMDPAVRLTGMVNLAEDVYIGQRPQVLALTPAVSPKGGA
jgi:hypothetical protein